MKFVIFLLFLPIGVIAQQAELYLHEWTLYPNFSLENKLEVGDSLVFIVNDSIMYNPEITLRVNKERRAVFGLTSFAYPTENGIVLSTEDPEPTYTVTWDTIRKKDSIEIIEYKVQNHIQVFHGPAIVNICVLNEELLQGIFNCGIVVGYGHEDVIDGPFDYYINEEKLVLIKR